jgi:hypothetical protein
MTHRNSISAKFLCGIRRPPIRPQLRIPDLQQRPPHLSLRVCRQTIAGHWGIGAPVWDLDHQYLLPQARGCTVRHSPVQSRHFQQAGHHLDRLKQRQLEGDLVRQAELYCCIGEHRRLTGAAVMRREPGHLRSNHPLTPVGMCCRATDQPRVALVQHCRVTGPVRHAIAGGFRLADPARLTAWVRDVNPSRTEFCNKALPIQCSRVQTH